MAYQYPVVHNYIPHSKQSDLFKYLSILFVDIFTLVADNPLVCVLNLAAYLNLFNYNDFTERFTSNYAHYHLCHPIIYLLKLATSISPKYHWTMVI